MSESEIPPAGGTEPPPPPPSPDEESRLATLRRYQVLDSEPEPEFDDLALLASLVCGTPMALISLVDRDRQWFKARIGFPVQETARNQAFCAHGILDSGVFEVPDARLDPRFENNPLVTGDAGIRFYAGAQLRTPEGLVLGMLCVKDRIPRDLSAEQKMALQILSRQVVDRLESRKRTRELRDALKELQTSREPGVAGKPGTGTIKESELRQPRALDAATAHIAILDENGVIVEVNAAWDRFASANGFRGQLRGRGDNYIKLCESATGPGAEEGRAVATGVREVLAGRMPEFQLNYPCHSPKHQRWFHLRVTRLAGPGPVRALVAHENITAQTLAETALRESELRFRSLFQHMLEGYAYCRMLAGLETGEDFIYLEVNRAFESLTGLANVTGKRVSELIPGIQEQNPELFASYRRVAALGEPEKFECELAGLGKWFAISVYSDQPGYFVAIFDDITGRKKAEESLLLLNSAVEHTQEAILITDAQLDMPGPRILYVNPAYTRLRGCTAAEVIGKTPRIFQGPRTDRAVLRRLRQKLERGEGFSGEVVNYRNDGSEFDLEWQIAPIRDARGKVTHFVAAQRDVTARNRGQAELEAIHRDLVEASRFGGMAEVATSVLHNVGNVLNSVNVSTNLLLERLSRSRLARLAQVVNLLQEQAGDPATFLREDPRGRQIIPFLAQLTELLQSEREASLRELEQLRRDVEHIKVIVAAQQDFARTGPVREMVPPASLLEDSVRVNEDELSRHQVEVIREFADLPATNLERHKVLLILVNLIRNAQWACGEAHREDPQIVLRLTTSGGKLQFTVQDNGVGIAEENLGRLFNHGFTTRKNGHGFGLHSSATVAHEMGGTLTASSAGRGHGATFILELPQPEAPEESAGSPEPASGTF